MFTLYRVYVIFLPLYRGKKYKDKEGKNPYIQNFNVISRFPLYRVMLYQGSTVLYRGIFSRGCFFRVFRIFHFAQVLFSRFWFFFLYWLTQGTVLFLYSFIQIIRKRTSLFTAECSMKIKNATIKQKFCFLVVYLLLFKGF